MLFTINEKQNFNLLENIIDGLNSNFQIIEQKYMTNDKQYFNFDGVIINYEGFKENLKYSFIYSERILVDLTTNFLENKQIEEIKNIISNLNFLLNHNLQQNYTHSSILHTFAIGFFSPLYQFFYNFKERKEAFKVMYSNFTFEARFVEFSDLLKSILSNFTDKENINKYKVKDISDRLNILNNKFEELSNKIIIDEEIFKKRLNDFFDNNAVTFDEKSSNILMAYNKNIKDIQDPYEKELKTKISELIENFDNNKYELESLLGDVKLYQDKMTNKAVSEMSAHYYEKSKFEKKSYFAVTIASVFIIICSVVSAYNGVNGYYNQYVSTEACDKNEVVETQVTIIPPVKFKSYQECMKDLTTKREATQKYAFNYLIFRLSFSLLLFLAVIYASRIAMRAYNHWRQSENMYLKLNTLSPFIGSLDKSVRNDVHLSLVPDYFGKDAGMVDSSKDTVKDIPTNISNIAIKAIEQAGSTIGSKLGSDKETKTSDSEPSTEKNKKKSEDE